jgi:HAD superfamily hydrolase (TIGR01509 family)
MTAQPPPRNSPYGLVIFDCDGVLVDSERVTNHIFAAMLTDIGLPSTLESVFEHFVGRSTATCQRVVKEMLGHEPPAGFWEEYERRTVAAMQRELVAVDGIGEALDNIALPWCVASSGSHAKMRTTLGLTGLLPRFEGRLFSATEVERGKPAPDLFLHAAARCGVSPGTCLLVEDSPAGVAGGIAAGMTVCGYAAHAPAHRLRAAGAQCVITDMRTLPAIVYPDAVADGLHGGERHAHS